MALVWLLVGGLGSSKGGWQAPSCTVSKARTARHALLHPTLPASRHLPSIQIKHVRGGAAFSLYHLGTAVR